jgi:ABC-2 type transport system ATP-binding protein
MSSHLLGEIERVCERIVVIDGGRLMRADTIASMTEQMQVLTVEVDSRQEELAGLLSARGLEAASEGHYVYVTIGDTEPYDIVRDAVIEIGAGLLRLERRRHRLEDLFRAEEEAVGG